MATVAELQAHLHGGGGVSAKVQKLQRYVALRGVGAANPGAGAPGPPQSAGDSVWHGVKNVGANTLHAL